MRKLLRFTPLLALSGCQGEWVVPWQSAELIKIDMLGVMVSWPVIAVATGLLAAAWAIRAKCRKVDKQ